MIDPKHVGWIVGVLLALSTALPACASSYNTSFYIRLTADDGEIFELQSRQILKPGRFAEERNNDWGIAFAVDEGEGPDGFRLTMRCLEKVIDEDGFEWIERAGTVGAGTLGAPFDVNLKGKGVAVESSFFVSRIP